MTKHRISAKTGTFVLAPLGDGTFGYGRIINSLPTRIAFYRLRTKSAVTDLDVIAKSPIAFTASVRIASAEDWTDLGRRDLEQGLRTPAVFFHQDIGDYRNCTIWDSAGNERRATPEECVGLEPDAVWDPAGIAERLLDLFEGRPNEHLEAMKVRLHA